MLADRVKQSLSSLFAGRRREQFLAQYVVRECRSGRSLAEVMADPYVVNRSTPAERARLLDAPEVVEAIGDSAIADARAGLGAYA